MNPFGPLRHTQTIAKATKDEREVGDGVLAVSVFVPPSNATSEELIRFLISVPVSGKRMHRGDRQSIEALGYELVWDPIRETDRHYLLPFGRLSDEPHALDASLATLETAFGPEERNPAWKSGGF